MIHLKTNVIKILQSSLILNKNKASDFLLYKFTYNTLYDTKFPLVYYS